MVFTIINACFTIASLTCAIIAINQTKKQTEIMKDQLEESRQPNFPLTMRLETISNNLIEISKSIQDSKLNTK